MKQCPKCKKKFPKDGKFCPFDGTKLVDIEEEQTKIVKESPSSNSEDKKWFSETKWFMTGDKIKDEDVTPEDIPVEDLEKLYRKTRELPPEIRQKYSLSYIEEKKEKDEEKK